MCSSGIGFDPMVGGKRLTFGFEGIWQGTAVLYDHQTRSIWMHLTGVCLDGKLKGTVLERIPTGRHTRWSDWRRLHPQTDVIALDKRWMGKAGDKGYFDRRGAASGNPYVPIQFHPTIQTQDKRFPPHELLYGVVVGDVQRAYPFFRLEKTPVVEERVGGVEVTVWFDRGSRSAAAFGRKFEGALRSFALDAQGAIRDEGTKSRWTMDGLCVEGELRGKQLVPLRGLMSEWYGWYANYPGTSVWGSA